jgi:AhpC/TSA family
VLTTRRRALSAGVLALNLVFAGNLAADELANKHEAPPFALQGSDGKEHRLGDYRGKTVVLAWFPKAFTGG